MQINIGRIFFLPQHLREKEAFNQQPNYDLLQSSHSCPVALGWYLVTQRTVKFFKMKGVHDRWIFHFLKETQELS